MERKENISLRPYNSFGIDVNARRLYAVDNADVLSGLLEEEKISAPLILGGGSNVLLTKEVEAPVLLNRITGIEVISEDEDQVLLRTGAGENWHSFVIYCVKQGFGGIENLSLIPGSNGASPMQNIGAYGVEIKDVFEELEAFHMKDKSFVKFKKEDCGFGYRESVFKNKFRNQFFITSVTYRLSKKPVLNTSYGAIEQELERMGVANPTIQDVSNAVINIRSSKLPNPAEIGNAGSFFKNPFVARTKAESLKSKNPSMPVFEVDEEQVKVPAGWLIEQCGWKGFRRGDAGCYSKQALVLVNYGTASGKEIYDLSSDIVKSVEDKFGIMLEREVNVY